MVISIFKTVKEDQKFLIDTIQNPYLAKLAKRNEEEENSEDESSDDEEEEEQ